MMAGPKPGGRGRVGAGPAGYRYSASRNMYHDPATGFFFDIASQARLEPWEAPIAVPP